MEKTVEKIVEKTSGKILELIASNNIITIPELSSILGISESSVERNIQKLQSEKKLIRQGAAKGGQWVVLI